MTRPQVSILLPVRNAADTLPRCLESIRTQTVQDWELVLADDGSTDASVQIARNHFSSDLRLHVLERPFRGIVQTLNAAATAARGALLLRMDADDTMHPERIERQARFLDQYPDIDLVASTVAYMGTPSTQPGYARYVEWTNSLVTEHDLTLNRFVESPLAHPSVAMRKQAFLQWGGYQEGPFPEDYALWLEAWQRGARIAKLPEPLLNWYDPPSRLSRNDPRYATEAFYKMKCRYLHQWIAHQIPRDARLVLWGAGRITRNRFRELQRLGSRFEAFVDVDERKIGNVIEGAPVLAAEALHPSRDFVIAGVGSQGARTVILERLRELGFTPGQDCIAAA